MADRWKKNKDSALSLQAGQFETCSCQRKLLFSHAFDVFYDAIISLSFSTLPTPKTTQ